MSRMVNSLFGHSVALHSSVSEIEQFVHSHAAMKDQRAGHRKPDHHVSRRIILPRPHSAEMLTTDIGDAREVSGADSVLLHERF